MKDFSSYGYMQGPIKAMVLEDLNKMGIVVNSSTVNKRRSKTPHSSYVNLTQAVSQHEKSIYGKPLQELETRPVPGQPYIRVPRLLLRSCNFLSHHLDTEGLFRKSGSVARQKVIRTSLNEGHSIDEDSNPHDVANLLKQFLRELPEPLITFELYDAFIQAQSLDLEEDKIQSILLLCLMLPDINRHTLQFLVKFLQTVSDNNQNNKMSVSNLAVVNTPNLIWGPHKDPNKIKLETALMESLIQAGSEIGLVPEDIILRAHKMLLELSGIWGVSEQEAAYKIPITLKGKRKRSGSLSGILTSVFKHNRSNALRSAKRKSCSNQDLTEVKLKDLSANRDLSFSTPCIIKTPAPSSKSMLSTPLLTAKRRTALLRQTPVDPRKKPKTQSGASDTECDSPVDMDPPKKRSKFDFSPRTEPVDKKRKNFKQRLSEGLSSRYRKSRLKRKRARGSNASDTPVTAHHVISELNKKKREKTPVFCFKGKTGSFNDQQRRISSNSDVVVNHCTRYIASPAQPELVQYADSPYSSVQGSMESLTPGTDKIKHLTTLKHGKKLFPSPMVESDEDVEVRPQSPISPDVPEVLLKRNNSYLQSWKSMVGVSSEVNNKTGEVSGDLPRRSPRLRRSAPVSIQHQVQATSESCTPMRSSLVRTGGLRRSPRLSGEPPEFPQLPYKTRTLSGNSYTAVKHRVNMNSVQQNLINTISPPVGENTSLNNSMNMAALITPETFSRTRHQSRSSERRHKIIQAEPTKQAFSPIRISLRNITPGQQSEQYQINPPPPQRDTAVHTRHSMGTTDKELSINLTELFTSRDITRLDMSLNVSEFADTHFAKHCSKTLSRESRDKAELPSTSPNIQPPSASFPNTTSYRSVKDETLDDSVSELCKNRSNNSVQSGLNSENSGQTSTLVSDNPTVIFSANAGDISVGKAKSVDEGSLRVDDKNSGLRINKSDRTQMNISQSVTYITTDSSSLGGDDSSVPSDNPAESQIGLHQTREDSQISGNNLCVRRDSHTSHDDSMTSFDDSRVTYITQNQSSFFNHTAINQSHNSTIVPYPKIGSMPNMVSLSLDDLPILREIPPLITPPPYVSRSNNFINIPSSSSSQTNIPKISETNKIPEKLSLKSPGSIFGCGSSARTMPQGGADSVSTCSETMNCTNIVTLPNRLMSDDLSLKSRLPVGIKPLPQSLSTCNPPSTPLTYAEKHQTSSKEAVVVKEGDIREENTTRVRPDLSVKPDLSSVIVQDAQVSSSSSPTIDLVADNTSNKENLAKTPVTPKSNTELDTTKINITPRTKISKGFTKNLASQWENMNRDEKTTSRLTRTHTNRSAKSRIVQSSAVTRSTSDNSRPGTNTKQGVVSTKQGAKQTPARRGTLRQIRTATRTISRTASARNTRTPAPSVPRNSVIRTKSDTTVSTPAARPVRNKAIETPKPAWRF